MSDELMNRARELLALRECVTPAPWATGRHGHGDAPWLIRPAVAYQIDSDADAALIRSAHDMADTIRDLLAEVERLKAAIKRQAAAARQLHSAERALMSADREAAEKARKMTDADALDSLREANDILTSENETLRSRSEAAEARLRELASAEPVAWVDGENFVWPKGKRRPSNCDALIRRPEMPS